MHPRILITGGLGFLGHHLTQRLLRTWPDCQLTIVDNLSSTCIDRFWLEGRAKILVKDFNTFVMRGRRFDRIYHLASPVGSLGILEKTGYIAKEIIDLAISAGEAAAASGASLAYVSSSEIYGKGGRQEEEDALTVPTLSGARMEYSLGKLAGEHLLRNLSRRHGFRLTIIRPFNIIGEHQDSSIGFVVPTFFERALLGEPLPVFYGGAQRRCFCHVADMVEGLIAVQEHGKPGHVYNLGNPDNSSTIAALAEKIREICGSASPLETVMPEERFGADYIEAKAKHPCIDKVVAHTGWVPRIELDAALWRIHSHYLEKRRNPADAEGPRRFDHAANR
jgi:UDP-glucose 4-epimerase